MNDPKVKIRKGAIYNRRMLAEDVWRERNQRIESQTLALINKKNVTSCHVFLPIRKNKEFDTWELIKVLDTNGVEVVLSVSDFETYSMSHFIYQVDTEFELNKFQIPEPVNAKPADISRLQMVLVPLLSADKKGNRIGYGKGFYDRLFAQLPQKVVKVGVNFAPLFDEFPFVEPHDVKLDFCVTPFKTYDFHE